MMPHSMEPSGTIYCPPDLRHRIVRLAIRAWPEECCGLLIADRDSPNAITRIVTAQNVAPDRHATFEVDPAVLIGTHRAVRDNGEAIVGCFHSHPNGDVHPSKTDLARAEEAGFLWLIVATRQGKEAGVGMYRRMPVKDDEHTPRHFIACRIVDTL